MGKYIKLYIYLIFSILFNKIPFFIFHFVLFQAITQSLVLAICMNFLFVRINFILKLFIGCIVIGFYSWIVFAQFSTAYEVSFNFRL